MNRFAALAAVVLPAALLGAGLGWLGRSRPPPEHPSVPRHDKAMAAEPDVVLLGASKLATDLDRAGLARELGLPAAEVVSLGLSGTSSPVWYTVLENRVLRAGHRPRLVVVYSTLDWTLSTELSRPGRAIVDAQRGESEPVLQEKVFGTGARSPFWERVEAARGASRDEWLATVRDATVGLSYGVEPPLVAGGKAMSAPALERLFGLGAAVVEGGAHRAIPVVEQERGDYEVGAQRLDQTLVPDLVRVAQEMDAHIVFVRAPVRADVEARKAAPPELVRELVAWLNAQGEGYIDLRDLNLPASAFGDGTHLSAGGRRTLTRELGRRLVELGVLGSEPLAAARLPVEHAPPLSRRQGQSPLPSLGSPKRGQGECDWLLPLPAPLDRLADDALVQLGFGAVSPLLLREDGEALRMHARPAELRAGCAGIAGIPGRNLRFSPRRGPAEAALERAWRLDLAPDFPLALPDGEPAWWVYPGTTAEFRWEEAFPPGEARVVVAAYAVTRGSPPRVRVGGVEQALVAAGDFYNLDAAVTPGPVEIESPADGPFLYLQRVALGPTEDLRWAVGSASPRTVTLGRADLEYAAPPPEVPDLGPPGVEGPMAVWDLAPTRLPPTQKFWAVGSVGNCTPVRVLEDGQPLPSSEANKKLVAERGAGHFGQDGTRLYAIASDGSIPGQNGRSYRLAYAEDRKCAGMRWLYPGDRLHVRWKPADLAALPTDPVAIELAGVAVSEPEEAAVLSLVLRSAGVEVWRGELPVRAFPAEVPMLTLPAPLPRTSPVEIELSLPEGAPWLLLTAVGLRGS